MTGAFNPGVSRKMMPGMEQISTDLSAVPHASGIQRATAANRQIPAYAPRAIVDLAPNLFERDTRGSVNEPARPLLASVLHLEPGFIDLSTIADADDDWIGLLILDGLLLVELHAGRAQTGWLAASDDILCPWDMDEIALNHDVAWRALTPLRVALLDQSFSIRAGGIPALARTLVRKTARTTNWLLAKSVVLASPLVEERLLLAFALFGERWGTVNREGVVVKLPLTHALLATLCGVRRPSVTVALHSLEAAGFLTRTSDGNWLLRRIDGQELTKPPSCWPQYSDALGLSAAGNGSPHARVSLSKPRH